MRPKRTWSYLEFHPRIALIRPLVQKPFPEWQKEEWFIVSAVGLSSPRRNYWSPGLRAKSLTQSAVLFVASLSQLLWKDKTRQGHKTVAQAKILILPSLCKPCPTPWVYTEIVVGFIHYPAYNRGPAKKRYWPSIFFYQFQLLIGTAVTATAKA